MSPHHHSLSGHGSLGWAGAVVFALLAVVGAWRVAQLWRAGKNGLEERSALIHLAMAVSMLTMSVGALDTGIGRVGWLLAFSGGAGWAGGALVTGAAPERAVTALRFDLFGCAGMAYMVNPFGSPTWLSVGFAAAFVGVGAAALARRAQGSCPMLCSSMAGEAGHVVMCGGMAVMFLMAHSA